MFTALMLEHLDRVCVCVCVCIKHDKWIFEVFDFFSDPLVV